jgi:NADH-quinone oxidoreductase subunit J
MPLALAQSDTIATALFYLFALMAAGSAIGVALSQNIVRMAVCLLFTLAGVAGLYFLLSAEFLAAVQLVVYAGGTLILIIFGVMLTSKSPFSKFAPKRWEVLVAVSLGLALLAVLIVGFNSLLDSIQPAGFPMPEGQTYPMVKLGQVLLGDFLVPFEVVSVLLLIVMIGAAYLAKARKRTQQQ